MLKQGIPVQLKAKECRMVLGVCNAAKTPEQKVWKELDLRLTDAANESKDNVKFLSTLEKTLEPMYEGSPQVRHFLWFIARLHTLEFMHWIVPYPPHMQVMVCALL